MRNRSVLILTGMTCVFTLLARVPAPATAQSLPRAIGISAVLKNPDGTLKPDASYTVTFSLYSVAVGGAAVWSETKPVSTVQGLFNTALGTVTPFNSNVQFQEKPYYLGIAVGSDPEATPRLPLLAAPYALALPGFRTENPTYGTQNIIGGYFGNYIGPSVVGATISGGGYFGFLNRVLDDYGAIGGGTDNQAGDGIGTTEDRFYATVAGGVRNAATGMYSSVGGGHVNRATGGAATVSGGYVNNANGYGSFIGGGYYSTTQGYSSTIGGGIGNRAMGDGSTVGGGGTTVADGVSIGNNATGYYSTIGGGSVNSAAGANATVPGGNANAADGSASFAAGNRAKANHDGAFTWADNLNFDFASTAANQFSARATGGVRLITAVDANGAPTAGVSLAPGDNAWSALSDRNTKDHFNAVDDESVLERVAAMPITTWNYKTQDGSIRHMGPMAQDFRSAFGLGADERHISSIDADGVALAAIQGLYKQVQDRDAEIAALRAQNAATDARLKALEEEFHSLRKVR